MTDVQFKTQYNRVDKLAKKWLGPLGLLHWKVTVEYCRQPLETSSEGWDCLGRTSVKWEYADASISINLPGVSDLSDSELEKIFVHECCHVLVNEMREWCHDHDSLSPAETRSLIRHEERVVTDLTRAFIWTYNAGVNNQVKEVVRDARKKKSAVRRKSQV